MDAIAMFAERDRNLEALRSFQSVFEFKKILESESELNRKISFDQLGEIVDLIMTNPGASEISDRLTEILSGT